MHFPMSSHFFMTCAGPMELRVLGCTCTPCFLRRKGQNPPWTLSHGYHAPPDFSTSRGPCCVLFKMVNYSLSILFHTRFISGKKLKMFEFLQFLSSTHLKLNQSNLSFSEHKSPKTAVFLGTFCVQWFYKYGPHFLFC